MEATPYKGPPRKGDMSKISHSKSHNSNISLKPSSIYTSPYDNSQALEKLVDDRTRSERAKTDLAVDRFPHRMTVGAHQRMAELDFDPLEWSVKIARGEALTKDHPFLDYVIQFGRDIIDDLEKGNPVDMEAMILSLMDRARQDLTDSYVPLNLRSDHIKELMQYLYPKLKSVEHSGTIQQHIKIKPLTSSEVELFRDKFNAKY